MNCTEKQIVLYFFTQPNIRTSNLFSSFIHFCQLFVLIYLNLIQKDNPLLFEQTSRLFWFDHKVYFQSYILGCGEGLISIVLHCLSFFEMFLSILPQSIIFVLWSASYLLIVVNMHHPLFSIILLPFPFSLSFIFCDMAAVSILFHMGHLGFCLQDYVFLYLLYFFCFPDDFCVLLSVSTITTCCIYGHGKFKHSSLN